MSAARKDPAPRAINRQARALAGRLRRMPTNMATTAEAPMPL
jgi:hypothetical protein